MRRRRGGIRPSHQLDDAVHIVVPATDVLFAFRRLSDADAQVFDQIGVLVDKPHGKLYTLGRQLVFALCTEQPLLYVERTTSTLLDRLLCFRRFDLIHRLRNAFGELTVSDLAATQ